MKVVSDPETIALTLDELRYQCCSLLSEPTVSVVALNRSELMLLLGGLAAYERITWLTQPLLDVVEVWHSAGGLTWLEANEKLHCSYQHFKRLYDAEVADLAQT
jgi:hypothetical protein